MIELIKDPHGRILAVCEYLFCDSTTLKEDGEILFVGEFYVNPDQHKIGLIMEIIRTLYNKYPKARYLQFFRNIKYPGRPGREYTRKQVKKLIGA
jgi:hypothetical protein